MTQLGASWPECQSVDTPRPQFAGLEPVASSPGEGRGLPPQRPPRERRNAFISSVFANLSGVWPRSVSAFGSAPPSRRASARSTRPVRAARFERSVAVPVDRLDVGPALEEESDDRGVWQVLDGGVQGRGPRVGTVEVGSAGEQRSGDPGVAVTDGEAEGRGLHRGQPGVGQGRILVQKTCRFVLVAQGHGGEEVEGDTGSEERLGRAIPAFHRGRLQGSEAGAVGLGRASSSFGQRGEHVFEPLFRRHGEGGLPPGSRGVRVDPAPDQVAQQ